jgi:hypothetical protein
VIVLLLGACSPSSGSDTAVTTSTLPVPLTNPTATVPATATSTTTPATTTTTEPPTTTTISPFAPPDWLGTQPLPLRPDGHGEVLPTPAELVDRAFATPDVLPPPPDDEYHWTVSDVPDDVLARSSWIPECPVTVDDLAYVTVSHYGFDGEFHTGELLVNATVAMDLVEVFRRLHQERFPIEEMRVVRLDEVDDPPTGDWNETTSFVCRPAVGSQSWSRHAYGLAVDINPFHNPYEKADLVIPELASFYTDRSEIRPGMLVGGDVVTSAFAAIGWSWGGNWNSLKDYMHFSTDGG